MGNETRQIYRAGEAAPFNPSPRWPEGYLEVLAELGVPARQRGFYAHWVRQFFNREGKGRRRRDLGRAEMEHFLGGLARDERVQPWQVEQARAALEIYYEQFRGIALDRTLEEAEAPPAAKSGPGPAEPKRRAGRPVGQSGDIGRVADVDRIAATPVPLPRSVRGPGRVPEPLRHETDGGVHWPALEKALRTQLRVKHYSLKTERSYVAWGRRFVAYHHGRNPSTMGAPEIHAFLSHLAIEREVAASTQNQALNAIVFLYREVIKREPGDFSEFARARIPKRLPVVLSRGQVADLLNRLEGTEALLARLMYGTGMRVAETLRLRVQDLAFDRNEILVRGGKGDKDRRVPLPASLREWLKEHLAERRRLYDRDRRENLHEVELPDALGYIGVRPY